MGTNRGPLLADIFLYSYEADFKRICSQRERSSYHLGPILLLGASMMYVHNLPRIRKVYGPDASYWTWNQGHHRDHHFCFLSRITLVDWEGWSMQLYTSIYDKRDGFNFHITNFLFLSSDILFSPVYGVLSLILYEMRGLASRIHSFSLKARRISNKLLKQGCLGLRLKSHFGKFYSQNGDLIQQYEVFLSRMLNAILTLDPPCLLNQSDFPLISWRWYRIWPSPNNEWFPCSICNECGMPAGNALLSGPLVPSPVGGFHMLWLLRPVFPTLPRCNDRTELDLHWVERFQWSICDGRGIPAGSTYPSRHLVPSPCLCTNYWNQ